MLQDAILRGYYQFYREQDELDSPYGVKTYVSSAARISRRFYRHRRVSLVGVTAIAVFIMMGRAKFAEAQYTAETLIFQEKMDAAEAELTATLKGGEYVEDHFYPDRQVEECRRKFENAPTYLRNVLLRALP